MISPRHVRSLPTREFSSAASIPSPNRESFNMTSQLHRAESDVGRVLHLTESNVASRPSHPRVFFARVDSFARRRILHHDLTAPRSMSRRVLATRESSPPASIPSANDESFIITLPHRVRCPVETLSPTSVLRQSRFFRPTTHP